MKPSTTTKILLLLFTATITTTNGQTVINNTLTDAHRHVPGTELSLLLPPGFKINKTADQFRNNSKDASIYVSMEKMTIDTVLPAEGFFSLYNEVEGAVTKEVYIINGYKAYLCGARYPDNIGNTVNHWVLYVGIPGWSTYVNANYAVDDTATGAALKQSLLSVVYDTAFALHPFAGLTFSINYAEHGYRFETEVNSMLAFLPEGHTDTNDPMGILVAGEVPIEEQPDTNYLQMAKQMLKDNPFDIRKAKSIELITLDGISGCEIEGEGKDSGKKVQVYIVLLQARYKYMLVAIAQTPEALAAMKKAISTFKLK